MQSTYQIVLKNEKLKFYHWLGWFIILILTLIYIYQRFFSLPDNVRLQGTVFLIAMGLALGLKLYLNGSKYSFDSPVFFMFLIAAFSANGQYLLSAITFAFLFLHTVSTREKKLLVNASGISFPSFPPKKIDWNELNTALLKDGLLTIDFRSDKLIQQYADENKTQVNEAEFNEFCRQQLKK